MNMTVGTIIEYLIQIKDRNRQLLLSEEVDVINDACNILSHWFPRTSDAISLINEGVSGYEVSKTQIMDWMHEAGFRGDDTNFNCLVENGLREAIALHMKHKAEEVVYDFTRQYRKELKEL